MLVEVLVNETFKDKHNPKKKFEAGKKYMLTAERVKEIKEVKPTLVTEIAVISDTEDEVQVPNEEPVEDSKKEQKK